MADKKPSGESGKLTAAETAALTVNIAKGLERVHGEGLAHRETKPNNILLDEPDEIDKFLRRIPPRDSSPGIDKPRVDVDISIIRGKDQDDVDVKPPRFRDRLPSLADRIKDLTPALPDDYDGRKASLAELNAAVRKHLAEQLAPALNAHIQAMPHGTYEEKKALARWVNEELRQFDLAIKCPKTGRPAYLVGDPGNHPEIGRFCIEIKTEDGKKKRTVATPQLPHLELMEAPPRREALLEWMDKSGGSQRGGARGR